MALYVRLTPLMFLKNASFQCHLDGRVSFCILVVATMEPLRSRSRPVQQSTTSSESMDAMPGARSTASSPSALAAANASSSKTRQDWEKARPVDTAKPVSLTNRSTSSTAKHRSSNSRWDKLGGGLNLAQGETRVLAGLTLLGSVVRLWKIGRPSSVV